MEQSFKPVLSMEWHRVLVDRYTVLTTGHMAPWGSKFVDGAVRPGLLQWLLDAPIEGVLLRRILLGYNSMIRFPSGLRSD